MTISTTTNRNDYIGTGSTDSYDYTFKIFAETDLLVTKRDQDNVETTLVLDVDYTVDGVGDDVGGSIVLAAGNLSSDFVLSIRRVRPLVQDTDIRNQGDFFPETHEDAFDHFVMCDQQQQDEIDRSVKLPETIDPSDVSVELPIPEANKILSWNAAADALENADADVLTISASQDMRVDTFVSGVGFTAGSTTQLTLSQIPGAKENTTVFFDGVYQPLSRYSISGTTVTFAPAITIGVAKVEIKYLRTLDVNTADAHNVSYTPAGTDALETNVQDKLREFVSVVDFGAVGNGTTDDTDAIQAAIDSLVAGGNVFFPNGTYKCVSDLTVTVANITLSGEDRASKIVLADGKRISVSASGFTAKNLWIDGTDYSTGTETGALIHATGADASNYLKNISIEHCYLTNACFYGIHLLFVDGIKIIGCHLEDVYYAGIAISSSKHGVIQGNKVINILGSSGGNSYGLFLSRTAGELATYPRCQFFTVSDNLIDNNPTWEGLDTHAGSDIVWANNIVLNCVMGIMVGISADNVAPHRNIIKGNLVNSGVTDGSAGYGIVVTGAIAEFAEGCIVSGNSIIRHGHESNNSTGSALYIYYTTGLVVSANTFIEPSPQAIYIGATMTAFSITDNVCIDPFTNTAGVAIGRFLNQSGNNCTGIIANNVVTTATKTATYTLSECLRFSAGATGGNIQVGNHFYTGTQTNFIVNAPAGMVLNSTLMFPQRYAKSTIPTTGTFSRGEIIWNSAPTVNTPLGWVCTTAGDLASSGVLTEIPNPRVITSKQVVATNSGNLDNLLNTRSYLKLNSATAKSLRGISGSGACDGQIILVHNTGGDLTVVNESASVGATDKIVTNTGGDITITGNGFVGLIRDTESSVWQVMFTSA